MANSGTSRPAGTVLAGAALVGAVLAGAVLAGCTSRGDGTGPQAAVVVGGPAVGSVLPDLVDKVSPSVVTIVTDGGLGSGIVYRRGGIIVTNAHVVGEYVDVQVVLTDGRRMPGKVTATDATADLAVVKTDQASPPPAEFERKLPRQGAWVMAIGSPLGLSTTVTTGVVSGLNRHLPGSSTGSGTMTGLIQTDAAISPGNSGGALLDGSGRVVGVNEAYIPPQEGAVSLGFAIPSATVITVVDQLLAGGTVTHPYLGMDTDRLPPQPTASASAAGTTGVLVRETAATGPAARAGILAGDVVTSLDGRSTGDLDAYLSAAGQVRPGAPVAVTLRRNGAPLAVTIVAGTVPAR